MDDGFMVKFLAQVKSVKSVLLIIDVIFVLVSIQSQVSARLLPYLTALCLVLKHTSVCSLLGCRAVCFDAQLLIDCRAALD